MQEDIHLVSDLALILISAGVVTLIFRWLKQPLVLGYIVAGFLVGPHFDLFPTIIEEQSVSEWSEIGIIFLLFALGLEFSFKKLMTVGGSAIITAVTEVITMFCIGFVVGYLIGWTNMECVFLGGMLSMSSTTIIIKAFNDLGLRNQKFTTIVFGTLVVEDIVAILLMVMLSTIAVSSDFAGSEIVISLLKLAFFLILWFLVGIYVLPSLLQKARKWLNDETLLVSSIGLCFGMVALAEYTGFSAALGAFIMGSILAETIEGEHIEHLIKNIKDLFGAIFFVSVGMLVNPSILVEHWGIILILSLVTIFGKSFFSGFGVLLSGQSLKTAVQSGFSLAQIGEFAFIIASLGYSLGVMREFIYPVIVAISVITTFTTPYTIRLADPFYGWLTTVLPEKMKTYLDGYSSNSNTVNYESDWKKLLKFYATRIVVYSVILIAIVLCSSKFVSPFVSKELSGASEIVVELINGGITILAMSPFLIGLMGTSREMKIVFSRLWKDSKFNRNGLMAIFLFRIFLATFFILIVLLRIFKISTWISIVASVIIMIGIFYARKYLKAYQKIENRFIANLNKKDELDKQKNPIKGAIKSQLSNRDIHLADVDVSADSPFIGQKIKDLELRKKYGVNIVKIIRGSRTIFFPSGDEFIYPADHLLAIGTDEQIKNFTDIMELHDFEEDNSIDNYPEINLSSFIVKSNSLILGKNIANSGIRDIGALIVGIDRDDQSIMSPDMSFVFQEGDLVWIVGEKDKILKAVGSL